MALCRSAVGFQPEIVPSSVANMKKLGPEPPPPVTTKPELPLNTTPVGVPVVPSGLPLAGGIVTTSGVAGGNGTPAPLYRVLTPVPLSEIQKGLVGPNAMPQGFFKLASVWAAGTAPSDTKLVCR